MAAAREVGGTSPTRGTPVDVPTTDDNLKYTYFS